MGKLQEAEGDALEASLGRWCSGWRPGPLGTRGISHGDGKDRGSKSKRVSLGRKGHGAGTGSHHLQ